MSAIEYKDYSEQQKGWPLTGNHILANYDEESLVVYQAYKRDIAEAAVQHGFDSEACRRAGYSFERMSWIKPNFLWMMYRSGWANKPGQEHIIAIRITRKGFDEILANAVISSSHAPPGTNYKAAQVVLQWDPDHGPDGAKVSTGRRAIQLGLRGDMLKRLSNEFAVSISDITPFVHEQHAKWESQGSFEMPMERIYRPKDSEVAQHIRLDN